MRAGVGLGLGLGVHVRVRVRVMVKVSVRVTVRVRVPNLDRPLYVHALSTRLSGELFLPAPSRVCGLVTPGI